MEDELIHFSDEKGNSPCGDDNPDSAVTPEPGETTCEFCKHAIKFKKFNSDRVLH